ncbi:MAG: SDR family oxidoreductase [Pseudomonadota bacterium]
MNNNSNTEGRLKDKVAVITGGASGIGLATLEHFLQEGARVVFGDMNAENGDKVMTSLSSGLRREHVRFLQLDVSREQDVIDLMTLAESEFGPIDIVFNNAGIGGSIGPLVDTEVDHWDATFEVNSRGVFLGIKHGARAMIRHGGGGSIINTASTAGISGGTGPFAYSATKAAVLSMTKNAALELAEHHIRVNAVCPGIIFTPLGHGGLEEETEAVARIIQPLDVRGEPRHVASAVLYLGSEESAFITGEALAVDGGYLANGLIAVHPLPGAEQKKRYSGMTYGTTGKAPTVRKLQSGQDKWRHHE